MAWSMQKLGIMSIVFLLALNIVYHIEGSKFDELFLRRTNSEDTHGKNEHSYSSRASFTSNCLIFLANFSIFMIYFQFYLIGLADFGFNFAVPLFLQTIILFWHSNKHFTLHLRIISMDKYAQLSKQVSFTFIK